MYYDLYEEVTLVVFDWGNRVKNSVKLHDWTYWGGISEAFYCLKYSSSNSSHGEGSPTVIHDPPGAKSTGQPLAKVIVIHSAEYEVVFTRAITMIS